MNSSADAAPVRPVFERAGGELGAMIHRDRAWDRRPRQDAVEGFGDDPSGYRSRRLEAHPQVDRQLLRGATQLRQQEPPPCVPSGARRMLSRAPFLRSQGVEPVGEPRLCIWIAFGGW
jgi:hypothetical protein